MKMIHRFMQKVIKAAIMRLKILITNKNKINFLISLPDTEDISQEQVASKRTL